MESSLTDRIKNAAIYLIFVFLWLALCLSNCLLLVPRLGTDIVSAFNISSGITMLSFAGALIYGTFFITAALYGYKKNKRALVWLVLAEGILFLAAVSSLGIYILKSGTAVFDIVYGGISGNLLLKFWLFMIAPFHGFVAYAGSIPLFVIIPVFAAAYIILPVILLVKLKQRANKERVGANVK